MDDVTEDTNTDLYKDINTELRTKARNDFEQLSVRKTVENVRKHRCIKLVTTNRRRSHLVAGPNYHTTKWFSENLLTIEMNETGVKMDKPVYLCLSILDINKIAMCEFCMTT